MKNGMRLRVLLVCSLTGIILCGSPAFLSAEATIVPMVAGGYFHSVALKSDGTVWTWGRNAVGQLGDGSTKQRLSPIQVPGLTDMIMVDADGAGDTLKKSADNLSLVSHTMALKKDGTVWCWGTNNWGQLGDGTTTNRSIPVKSAGLSEIVALSAGSYHSLALKKDGTVWFWGSNEYGQAGDGTKGDRNFWSYDNVKKKPVQIKGLEDVAVISGGFDHSIALKKDGTVWSWGANDSGQIGNGSVKNALVPVKVQGLSDIISVSAGYKGSAAVKKDGTVYVWGTNSQGQLGNGSQKYREFSAVPVTVKSLSRIKSVSYSFMHLLALNDEGALFRWGNDFGLEPLTTGLTGIVSFGGGRENSIALKDDGTVWCSGYNSCGEFGNSEVSSTIQEEFIKVPNLKLFTSMVTPASSKQKALPTSSHVVVDGLARAFEAYTVGDSNYFKLRDIAMVMKGTEKEFEVTWDSVGNTIHLSMDKPYTINGQELLVSSDLSEKEAFPTSSRIYFNGEEVYMTAYTIGGSNYFKLRDLGQLVNFGVRWEGGANTIEINTDISYEAAAL